MTLLAAAADGGQGLAPRAVAAQLLRAPTMSRIASSSSSMSSCITGHTLTGVLAPSCHPETGETR